MLPTLEALERLAKLDEPLPDGPVDPQDVLASLDWIGSPPTVASQPGDHGGIEGPSVSMVGGFSAKARGHEDGTTVLPASLERGDFSQSPFGFLVSEDRWITDHDGWPMRVIYKIGKLYDVGPVAFPAYPQTSAGVRTISPTVRHWSLDLARRRLQLAELAA